MPVHKLTIDGVEPTHYYLPAEKLIAGNPRQSVWLQYTDPTKQFTVGVWYSEVGKWRISYTEEEYCQMLEGISVMTDERGVSVTVSAGESFVVPRGFVGTWEVVVPSKKTFVVYESGMPN